MTPLPSKLLKNATALNTALISNATAERCRATDRVELIVPTDTELVELDGIEPTTSCLQSRRSPN